MSTKRQQTTFSSPLLLAKDKGFLFAKIPPELSKAHLRLGRITARISIGSSHFDAQMEPDGKLGHWFIIPSSVAKKEALTIKERASFILSCLEKQPEPLPPADFETLLKNNPSAQKTWDNTTTLAKIDWIHWMESAKQEKTKHERAANAIDMLEKGKKRVCCFDPSGFYSKALTCPVEESESALLRAE
jgi:hypothetical protein